LIFTNEKPVYIEVFGKKYKFYPTIRNKKYSYYTLIPVSYYQKPGLYRMLAVYKNRKEKLKLKVNPGNYKKEYLKVSKNKVTPPKKVLERIKKEYKEAMKIYRTHYDNALWKHTFSLPLSSKITSSYGNARLFNSKLKSFHSGTDFRAKTGTPIRSVNDGIVVIAKNRYFAGNSVVVSHGRGIYSCYYHLSRILVKPGQKVSKNQLLGYSGKTGRITGPHLHFSMWLDGYAVNPLKMINLLNKI